MTTTTTYLKGSRRLAVIHRWLQGIDDPNYEVLPTKKEGKYIVKKRKPESKKKDEYADDEDINETDNHAQALSGFPDHEDANEHNEAIEDMSTQEPVNEHLNLNQSSGLMQLKLQDLNPQRLASWHNPPMILPLI